MYSTPESPNVKHCEQCGAVLPPKRKRFCSKTCNSAWRSANYRFGTAFVCEHCGVTFKPKASNRTRFCSRDCSYAHLKVHGRPERRKPQVQAEPWPTCEICGKPASIRTAKTCSEECRAEYNRRYSRVLSASKKAIEPRPCKECGKVFTPEYGNKRKSYCSDQCGKKARRRKSKKHTGVLNNVTRKRLRAMYGDSWRSMYEPINKRRVFERDKWRCQLCGCKVKRTTEWDPRQATIDHIIPLSLGGEHKYTNVQTACMECNSKKGATIQGQQRLFG